MTGIAFQPGRTLSFSSGAVQQVVRVSQLNAATANNECGCTDTPQVYAARGVIYGLLISAPLWMIISGAVYLACRMMG